MNEWMNEWMNWKCTIVWIENVWLYEIAKVCMKRNENFMTEEMFHLIEHFVHNHESSDTYQNLNSTACNVNIINITM